MESVSLEKPLKILTLDGGGLQAISTLLILDQLLDTIQVTNRAATKPRPCDVFDVIAGIGAGGWLALLLGRFQFDVKTCLAEWYVLLQGIAPRSRGQGLRRRVLAHRYFNEKALLQRIDRLTDLYGVGDKLIDEYPSDARCKHVFVAAAQKAYRSHDPEYCLFRSYQIPNNPSLRAGPEDPASFTIARAFGATGAARYFSAPWKEHIAADGKVSFLDNSFPQPHNITLLALEEMWVLYGTNCPISVIVNIGPGSPTDADLSKMARRFSWGLKNHETGSANRHRPSRSAHSQRSPHRKESPNPRTKKFRMKESQLKDRIRDQLQIHYAKGAPPYHRLSLDSAPQGTAQNDAREPGAILDATSVYCASESVRTCMDKISHIVEIAA